MSREEPTCQGSVSPDSRELLEDKPKRCECCGKVLSRSELKTYISLCEQCASVIDAQTEERLEREHFDGWFGDDS
jgi:acetyl-CoA carboxylase beta subunit